MHLIQVDDHLVATSLSGNVDSLVRVKDLNDKLNAAVAEAQGLLNNEVARLLAAGLARRNNIDGDAQMVVRPDGCVVVVVGANGDFSEGLKGMATKTTLNGSSNGGDKLPSIDDLRARAEAVQVDISDIDPRAKRKILDRIEAAEAAAASPQTVETDAEPDESEDDTDSDDTESSDSEDGGLDVDELLS